jgi:hypothetical protein
MIMIFDISIIQLQIIARTFRVSCLTMFIHPEVISRSYFINSKMLKQVQHDNSLDVNDMFAFVIKS